MIHGPAFRPVPAMQPLMPFTHPLTKPLMGQEARQVTRPAAPTVRFGTGPMFGPSWWFGGIPLNVEGDYVAGFTPDATVAELLPPNIGQTGALIIDKPVRLDEIWKKLGLTDFDPPAVDWQREVFVLVAQERSDGGEAIPQSMHYETFSDMLNIVIRAEKKPGRTPGMAWYLGKVSNGKDEAKAGGRSSNRFLTAATKLYMRQA